MSQSRWRDCQRCKGPMIETKQEMERRNYLQAKLLCPACDEEYEEYKLKHGLTSVCYIGVNETCPF